MTKSIMLRLRTAWRVLIMPAIAFATIYDHGDPLDPVEEYYEAFDTPEDAKAMWHTMAYGADDYHNARVVLILEEFVPHKYSHGDHHD